MGRTQKLLNNHNFIGMKGLLKFLENTTLTEIEKLRIAIKESSVCKPMHELNESIITNKDGNEEIRIWLNPHNQKCFNFGWFTHEDYYDWLDGGGPIVKGETDAEKRKFWEVAVFEKQHEGAWSFGYHKKHFHFIDETYRPQTDFTHMSRYSKNPLKIGKKNHEEIISKVFGDVCRYYADMSYEMKIGDRNYMRMDYELQGVKETLYMLGVGYYGASNLPEEPLNLSWIAEICKYKALYLYFVKNGVELPDFDFVYEYKK
jgi:hypothetical protein